MAFHRWQTRKVAENAAEYLEPGETVGAAVVCEKIGGGGIGGESATDVLVSGEPEVGMGSSSDRGFAVVATDRHVYVLNLAGFTSLGGVAAKHPIDQVEIELEKGVFRPDLKVGGASLTTMAFGGKKYARALVEFARQHGAQPATG